MAKSKTKNRHGPGVIYTIFCIILLLGVIGGAVYLWYNTDGFTTEIRSTYLSADGKIINDKTVEIPESEPYNIKVVSLVDKEPSYSVKVIANPNVQNFEYAVAGITGEHSFVGTDFTNAFRITRASDGFSIGVDKWDMLDILSKNHDGAAIELLGDVVIEDGVYFLAVVTIDKKQIQFELAGKLESIEWDKDGVQYE